MQKVKCRVCGEVVNGYVPRGGDGSLYRPRKHGSCDGRFEEGDLISCKHMVTQGRENQFGSWCVNCGEKVLEVERKVCRHCFHFTETNTAPVCKKKLMTVLPDMHVTYYVKDGSCWEQRT